MQKKIIVLLFSLLLCFSAIIPAYASEQSDESQAALSMDEAEESEAIYFPECPEEYVKAKAFYGYYILMDTDVIFALNEDETRFCVKFYGIGGNQLMVMQGDVNPDGTVTVDNTYNGLFGEDVQTMYEDALEEETDWAPIDRGLIELDIESEAAEINIEYYDGDEILQTETDEEYLVQIPENVIPDVITIETLNADINVKGVIAKQYICDTQQGDMNFYFTEDTSWHVQLETISDIFESDFLYDVTKQRHEYIFGDAEEKVEIQLTTIIGAARVMKLEEE